MPRVAKIKGKIYHIITKGINQQDIFSVTEDYEKTITILSKYRKKKWIWNLYLLLNGKPFSPIN